MAGTSVSSEKKEEFINEQYITHETVISSEKVEDFNEKQHLDDIEKTDYEHEEDPEDSPIEEVRAVVSK
jgi:hypothetical protein